MRYPLADLVAALKEPVHEVRRRCAMSGAAWGAAVRNGLTAEQADRYAVRCGLHPLEVWPSIVEEAMAECAAADCGGRFVPSRRGHRFCSRLCGERTRRRLQYQSDPELAERERERAAEYYRQCAPYVRARNRRYYEANRERVRARQQARREQAKADRGFPQGCTSVGSQPARGEVAA